MNKIGIFAVSLFVLMSVLLNSVTAIDARGGLKTRVSARNNGETKTGADNFLESQANRKVEKTETEIAKTAEKMEKKVDVTATKTETEKKVEKTETTTKTKEGLKVETTTKTEQKLPSCAFGCAGFGKYVELNADKKKENTEKVLVELNTSETKKKEKTSEHKSDDAPVLVELNSAEAKKKETKTSEHNSLKLEIMNRRKIALLELTKIELKKIQAEKKLAKIEKVKDAAQLDEKMEYPAEEPVSLSAVQQKSSLKDAAQLDSTVAADTAEKIADLKDATELQDAASEITPAILLELDSIPLFFESQHFSSKALFNKKIKQLQLQKSSIRPRNMD